MNGKAMIHITHDALCPERVADAVRGDSNGAVVTFLGSTRDFTGDRRVLHLEYEAYRPMADKQLTRVVEEIADRWGGADAAIAHRLGRLEIGELSLVDTTPPPHLEEAKALERDANSSWTFDWTLVASVDVVRGRNSQVERAVTLIMPR